MSGEQLQDFIRDEMMWTQQEFSAYIGVAANSVTRWVKGTYPVPLWVVRIVELKREVVRCSKPQ